MAVEKLQVNLTLLLPAMEKGDQCVHLLTGRLAGVRGVEESHIVRDNGTAQLCLHYDPNLVSLSRLERLAHQAGAAITVRYRHESLPFAGLDAADAGQTLEKSLQNLPGMLHASVNYAAGLLFVAYDSEILARREIIAAVWRMGANIIEAPGERRAEHRDEPAIQGPASEDEDIHDHGGPEGSSPGFLPHWMQERWTLVLVSCAGLALAIGWAGESFFGMAPGIARLLYLVAYVAGGYDVAHHAIPGLLRGRFDTDVLMLAAAIGVALLGEWTEGAFLLFLFALGHAGEHRTLCPGPGAQRGQCFGRIDAEYGARAAG